ncbi:MAG: exodeoxyribonuclease VII large subunit [Desulfuromonadaceae bacterium]
MSEAPSILTVSRLNALLRELVEDNFVQVLVAGELSNLSTPVSGHCYFTLKDPDAQLRAVMFRAQFRLLGFALTPGMQVICRGRVSLYAQRGELQLIVDSLEPQGVGSLQVAFEQLKSRLAAEGLFAVERKRPLPAYPRTIGVVTSKTGAAIHDILNVLRRRGAGVRVLLCPVRVQGEGAAEEIAAAVAGLNQQGEADVLIVGRGGGSLEDLWAFNEETVARALAASAIPVISAVGHEVDYTVADFVADLRAPTPSAAAELVAKSRLEQEGHLDHLRQRLATQMQRRLDLWRERLTGLERRLRSPRQRREAQQRRLAELKGRLGLAMGRQLRERRLRLTAGADRLNSLSPLQTLARGYAIVQDEATGRVIREATSLRLGQTVQLRFQAGRAKARIEELES